MKYLITALTALSALTTHAASENFNDNWRFQRVGEMPDGSVRAEEPADQLAAPAYNDSSWRKLDLPHDWGIEGPFRWEIDGNVGKLPWAGIGWYRKSFTLKEVPPTLRLEFDGVMSNADIYLNGKKLAFQAYGYTPFAVDIAAVAQVGENTIAVRVDAGTWGSRWYPGAGIYRDVKLYSAPTETTFVRHGGVVLTDAEGGVPNGQVLFMPEIQNVQMAKDARVVCRLYERKPGGIRGALVTESEEIGMVDAAFGVTEMSYRVPTGIRSKPQIGILLKVSSPRLWSPNSPELYVLEATLYDGESVLDTACFNVGFRTLKFDAAGFYLNGKKTMINGVCQHHDLGALGAAFHRDAAARQIRILKSFGVNAIRTSHNPPAEDFLDLCDEMGILVQDEAFDTWRRAKKKNDYSSLFKTWRQKDITAFVRRDRNHPCVFMWSIGNEVYEQNEKDGYDVAKELTSFFHRNDPTLRPTTSGNSWGDAPLKNDFAFGTDVYGCNYNLWVYTRFLNDTAFAKIPFHGSETSSTFSSRGEYFFPVVKTNKDFHKNAAFHVTSYDLQYPPWASTAEDQFLTLDKNPRAFGEFVWTGFDYIGEPTPFNVDVSNLHNFRPEDPRRAELEKQLKELGKIRIPSRSSYFGIVDLAGFKKDRYYLYQARWMPDFPMAHLLPHWNWPERIGETTPVHLYTSGDEAELFLNDVSLGKKKRGEYEYRFCWDDVKYQPGELKAVVWKNGKSWTETTMKTTGDAKKLAITADLPSVRADGLAFFTATVQDEEGLLVPRSCPVLKFEVVDGGEFVASDNGDPTSFESFQSSERKAFNGLALGIVRAKKGVAGMTVRVTSPGLLPAEITIPVK